MNNNNHFNTNNWIGTSHLDFFKNSSNALSNYTYNTSNILENHILINSNINYLYTSNSSNSNIFFTSNTSNLIIEKYDELIKEENEIITFPFNATLKHTYIYNKNNGGEIRFQNKSYITDTTGFPPGTPNYKVKVDIDGKLKLYWVYDPLVSLIYLGGWHEPISEIAGLVADSVNQGGLITGLEGQIVINKKFTDSELTLIWAYIEGVQAGIITPGQTTITPAENARDMLTWGTPEIPATPSTPLIPASPIQNANAISTFNQRVQQLASAREIIRTSTIVRISDALYQYVVQNPLTSFILGTGFTSAGIAYAVLQGIEYNRYYTGVIEGVIDQNSNLSAGVRLSLHDINQSNIIASNLIDYCSNTYNFGISQGFTNSNIITQQYLNAINTNELKLNQTNISNIFVASNVLSNINLNQGFINSNITNQQYISNLKTDNLFLNNGNISNINGISTNELIASGKIKENNKFLDNIYLTSNHLYNLSYNYTAERQYPSKLFTSSSIEGTATLLNKLVYKQILYLDTSSISYGSGFYEVFSSSTYDNGITNKDKLFNFNTSETTNSSRWGISLYNSGSGNYSGDNSIDGNYYGDWVILKLPQEILLTRYRIYQNSSFLLRAPAEWKCYGSKDGIIFNEITEAHQLTRLTSYSGGFYEKSLASTFTTQYQYIGFVFNKLLSTSGETTLNFTELQLFGKEIISNSIASNIYATSNAVKYITEFEMPRICKHYGIYCSIETPISINSTTYYKYDLNISQYLKKGVIQIGAQSGDTYYTYKLSMFYASNYFDIITAGQPNVCSYDIYMSYKQNGLGFGGGGYQGINICAVGVPPNPLLKNILDIDFWVMRSGVNNLDYITLVSRQVSLVRVVLEDRIG